MGIEAEAVHEAHEIIDTTISDLQSLRKHIVVAGDICKDCWSDIVHELTHDMEVLSHVLKYYAPEAEAEAQEETIAG
jgi:hypothetical protein